jgi:hypothetical protein
MRNRIEPVRHTVRVLIYESIRNEAALQLYAACRRTRRVESPVIYRELRSTYWARARRYEEYKRRYIG